jgi:hypothetical protein
MHGSVMYIIKNDLTNNQFNRIDIDTGFGFEPILRRAVTAMTSSKDGQHIYYGGGYQISANTESSFYFRSER